MFVVCVDVVPRGARDDVKFAKLLCVGFSDSSLIDGVAS